MDRLTVVRGERIEEREGRDGRIRPSTLVVWAVVRGSELLGEYRTRREALARMAREAR